MQVFQWDAAEQRRPGPSPTPLDEEVEWLYDSIADDESPAQDRIQAESKLERLGVDVPSLRDEFVSHQAIHTDLTKVREVDPESDGPSSSDLIEKRRSVIQRLRNRVISGPHESLETLANAGHLSVESFEDIVSITVHCSQ